MRRALYIAFAIIGSSAPAVAQVAGGGAAAGAGTAAGATGAAPAAGGTSAAIGGGTMGPTVGAFVPGGGSGAIGAGTLGPSAGAAPATSSNNFIGGVNGPLNPGGSITNGNAYGINGSVPYGSTTAGASNANPFTSGGLPSVLSFNTLPPDTIRNVVPGATTHMTTVGSGAYQGYTLSPFTSTYAPLPTQTGAYGGGPGAVNNGAINPYAGIPAGTVDTFQLDRSRPGVVTPSTGTFTLPSGASPDIGTLRNTGAQ